MKSTESHKKYWTERKLDWDESYLTGIDPNSGKQMWEHPHRFAISGILKVIPWMSLMEVGCGAGANLMNIVKTHPPKQLGGCDVNPDAIELCKKTFQGGLFKVGSVEDVMMSDKSTDVTLSDMCLIYIDPTRIRGVIQEIQRITRNYVILCEFHHQSWWKRLILALRTGYWAYNYVRLLTKMGFYDIMTYKLTKDDWPGGEPQGTFGHIILAKVPRR